MRKPLLMTSVLQFIFEAQVPPGSENASFIENCNVQTISDNSLNMDSASRMYSCTKIRQSS